MLPIYINKWFIHINYNYEGIYYLIAIISAIIYVTYLAKKENIDPEVMYEAGFICILTALITGRLFSFIFWEPMILIKEPLMFFQVWKGGLRLPVAFGRTDGRLYLCES